MSGCPASFCVAQAATVALQRPWDHEQPALLAQLTAPVRRAWSGYQQSLDERPTMTKAFTSFVGFALGDALAQKIEGEQRRRLTQWLSKG